MCTKQIVFGKLKKMNYALTKATTTTWKVLWDRLPTRENIQRREMLQFGDKSKCSLCGTEEESVAYLFIDCIVKSIWLVIYRWLNFMWLFTFNLNIIFPKTWASSNGLMGEVCYHCVDEIRLCLKMQIGTKKRSWMKLTVN